MDIFRQHEIFEIEILDKMNSAKVLQSLVFGGGTMLRLCHELNRYSADLDFWFVKRIPQKNTSILFRRRLKKTMKLPMQRSGITRSCSN